MLSVCVWLLKLFSGHRDEEASSFLYLLSPRATRLGPHLHEKPDGETFADRRQASDFSPRQEASLEDDPSLFPAARRNVLALEEELVQARPRH